MVGQGLCPHPESEGCSMVTPTFLSAMLGGR